MSSKRLFHVLGYSLYLRIIAKIDCWTAMKKNGSKTPKVKLSEVPKKAASGFFVILAYMGYWTEVRSSILSSYGVYLAGLTDGAVVATTLIIIASYVLVKRTS